MKMSYKLIDFDKNRIINKFGMQKGGSTEVFLANTCARRMQKYVPWRTGTLATTTTIRPGKVIYDVPYAKKQFYTNKGNGLRGKQWHQKMIANERDVVTREVEAYIKMKG